MNHLLVDRRIKINLFMEACSTIENLTIVLISSQDICIFFISFGIIVKI